MNLQYIADKNGNTISVVVPISLWERIRNKYQRMDEEFDFEEPSKEEIKRNIRQGLKELKLIKEGKLQTRPAKEFLNEV
ncbi:MAG: YxlC family protein [Bacteroidales bacterium]|nr:YxlC family protein [Bacteroidales bacterium]MCF8457467.1 YxlC family protein [Bacteroidales bacterium]